MDNNREAIDNMIREYGVGGGNNTYQTSYQTGPEVVFEKKTYYDEKPLSYQTDLQYGGGQQQSFGYNVSGSPGHELKRSGVQTTEIIGGGERGGYGQTNITTEYRGGASSDFKNGGSFGQTITMNEYKGGANDYNNAGSYGTTQYSGDLRTGGFGVTEYKTDYQTSYQPEENIKRSGVTLTTTYEAPKYEENVKRSGVIHNNTYESPKYEGGVTYTTSYEPQKYEEVTRRSVTGENLVKTDYYTSYEPQKYEETVKRSGVGISGPQIISNSDYKAAEYKDITPYDYRTGNFATFDYRPSEVKTITEYVEYKPSTTYISSYQPPKTEVFVDRGENVKRAGVTTVTEVYVDRGNASEEVQIRQMGEEIERIRASNSEIYSRSGRLQNEKIEITQRITKLEMEIEVVRREGSNNRHLQMQIDEKHRELDMLRASGGGVRVVENMEENNELLRLIKEREHESEVLKRKIEELEIQKKRYIAEMGDNKEVLVKGNTKGTAWCC